MTGASSITNVTAVAYGDMPLFLFHLLEFMDVDYEIDVDELNERWAQVQNLDEWTQFILKQTEDVTELHHEGAGVGHLEDARRRRPPLRAARHRLAHGRRRSRRRFYLRIAGAGQYRYPGADLGILVTRGRFMNDEHELLDRARGWISGIKAQYASVPLGSRRAAAARARAVRVQAPLRRSAALDARASSCEHLRGHAHAPVHVPLASRSSSSASAGAPSSRSEWPHYRDVVPPRGRGGAPVVRDERADAPRAHAGAGPGVRAGRRAGGRRRPGGADALALQAASVPRRLLAGRLDARRRSAARSQLRLRAVAVRRLGRGRRVCWIAA